MTICEKGTVIFFNIIYSATACIAGGMTKGAGMAL
jgi:hypothetical protein